MDDGDTLHRIGKGRMQQLSPMSDSIGCVCFEVADGGHFRLTSRPYCGRKVSPSSGYGGTHASSCKQSQARFFVALIPKNALGGRAGKRGLDCLPHF